MEVFIRRTLLLLPLCLAASSGATRIGGHSYIFPPDAFEGGRVETGAVGTVLIELAWPEMRPWTSAEHAVWPPRDGLRVLANGAAAVGGQAVPEAVLISEMPAELSVATSPSLGISVRASGRIPPPVPASPGAVAGGAVPGDGMVQVAVDAPHPPDATRYDVFVRAPISSVQEFVVCSRADSVPAPDCAQSFVDRNLILKVSYRRGLVAQWREIHARVLAFLADHEVK